jgi:ankyrin repeat protein
MEKGCDVNAKDDCGISPIHVAIPYPPILELLLQNGANINDTTNSNVTPLIKACISGNLAVCSLLLSYKPDVFIRNKAGSNALDIANRKGNVKMQKLLM